MLLEGVLADWLRAHNTVRYKGQEQPFSEGNIIAAIQALNEVLYDGLVRTNEKVYDLLCLGKSLPQVVLGDTKSFSLRYIDWEHPENNVYHVTEEFEVERRGRTDAYVPDIVLFVNGIPLVVIECKKPTDESGKDLLPQAVEQHIRNQKVDGIPHLFQYAQLLLAVNKNDALYATAGTPAKFWAVWREEGLDEEAVAAVVHTALPPATHARLFSDRPQFVRSYFDALAAEGPREVTGQDRALYLPVPPRATAGTGLPLHRLRRRREEDRPLPAIFLRKGDAGAHPGRA